MKIKRQKSSKKIIIFIITITLSLGLFGCKNDKKTEVSAIFDDLMGTSISVKLYDATQEDIDEIERIYSLYSQLTTNFDRNLFDSNSEYYDLENIYTINLNRGIKPVTVRKELFDLIKYAIYLTEQTNGYFNVGVGEAIDIWKKVIESRELYLDPEITEAEYNKIINDIEAVGQVDLSKVILNENDLSVYIEDSNVKLDLGAIAKGYATQLVIDYLESQNITDYMINAGNSNVALGEHPENRAYRIGLTDSLGYYKNGFIGIVSLNNKHVVTSGNYEQFVTYEGVIYHHIISPYDYLPKAYYTSVVLIGDDAGLLDAYSTAVYSMSVDVAIDFLETNELDYILYLQENNQILTNLTEPEFEISEVKTN
ncbi:MAG: FAD:protein FMN transferase [Acholeplasmataceae bacterium]|nr:FAD:protein FMN transferase [Acholeplasmataceae bacterium]